MQGSDDPDSEEGARCGAVSEDSNPMTFCSRIKVLKMNVAVLPLTSNLVNLIKIELLNDNSRWWFLIRWGGLNEYRDEGTSNQCDWRTTTHIWENLGDLILTILFWQLFLLFWFFFFPLLDWTWITGVIFVWMQFSSHLLTEHVCIMHCARRLGRGQAFINHLLVSSQVNLRMDSPKGLAEGKRKS